MLSRRCTARASDRWQNKMKRQLGGLWLEREIGRGAYGTVYLAVGPRGERAAVKVCRREDVGEERYERELRGAKLYRAIPPQNGLVRMRGLVEEDWGFYTVMDLADDEFGRPLSSPEGYRPKTLASVIDGEKALPLKECIALALSLANGLAALQRHHLLHRDIKPGNVLYVGGCPVLSDPGLVVNESAAVSTVGTPVYLPPEGKFTEPASDIYSLGLTLKAASFGRQIEDLDKGPAMEADTGAALFPAWWRILNKATDPTPSRRYQSAKALVKDLKTLRLKMLSSSSVWKKASKAVLWVVFLFALTFATKETISIYIENRRVIKESQASAQVHLQMVSNRLMEVRKERAKEERESRDHLWDTYNYQLYSHNTKSMVEKALREVEKIKGCADSIQLDIDEIRSVDAEKSEELQSCLDNVFELGEKVELLYREVVALHKKAKEKLEKGLDDEKEYLQAQKIAKEMYNKVCNLRKRISDLCSEHRRFFYDTRGKWRRLFYEKSHNVSEYWLSRDIDKIAAVDSKKAHELKSLSDKLCELDAKQKLLKDEILALRKKAERKDGEWVDDMAEFLQAQKIRDEECRLFDNEIKPLVAEIKSKRDMYLKDIGEDE